MDDMSVKYYNSGMAGAPAVSNSWGNLTALLDSVLVYGFGAKTAESLTRVGDIATAHISTGHAFNIGQVVKITGAFQADYNGEHRVLTKTFNSFTFEVVGTPPSPSSTTSSITIVVAPLGFEIVYTKLNKRAYRSLDPHALGNMLVVDDGIKATGYDSTWAKWGAVGIVESMSDIDTVTGPQAPFDPNKPNQNWTSSEPNQFGYYKWYYGRTGSYDHSGDSGSGARNWVIVGDSRMFYLYITNAAEYGWYGRNCYCFGDINSFKPGDKYSTVLHASPNYWSNSSASYWSYPGQYDSYGGITTSIDGAGNLLLRNHTQVGNPVGWSVCSLNTNNSSQVNGRGSIPFPNAPDYSIWLMPVYCRQDDSNMRGMMPGMRWLPQATGYSDQTIIDNVVGQEGRKFMLVRSQYSNETEGAYTPFDITGPWR